MNGQMGSLLALSPGQALGKPQAQRSYLQQVEGPASNMDSEVYCGRTREKRSGAEEKGPLQVASQAARC